MYENKVESACIRSVSTHTAFNSGKMRDVTNIKYMVEPNGKTLMFEESEVYSSKEEVIKTL